MLLKVIHNSLNTFLEKMISIMFIMKDNQLKAKFKDTNS